MSDLKGVPLLSEISQDGTIIDSVNDERIGRQMRFIDEMKNVDEIYDGDETRKSVAEKLSLNLNLQSAKNFAVQANKNRQVLIHPPENAFEGFSAKMQSVTGDGGLLKLIIVSGYEDTSINETDYVTFHYSGWLDGKAESFVSSHTEKKPVDRQIGSEGPAFIAMDLALKSMKKGETAYFMTCPAFSYGTGGLMPEANTPQVLPDEWILWRIEVLNVIAAGDYVVDIFSLRPDDRLKLPFTEISAYANSQRQLGKDSFHSNNYRLARKHFTKGLKVLLEHRILPEQEALEKKKLTSTLFGNIAVTCYKLEEKLDEKDRNYEEVFSNAENAVNFDANNARAWFMGAKSLRRMYRLEECREYLTRARQMQPNNTEVGDELRALDKDLLEKRNREKDVDRKMMGANVEAKSEKIPPSIENAVSIDFKKLVSSHIEKIIAKTENDVQFDRCYFTKSEVEYVCAAAERNDSISLRRISSELGTDVVEVFRKTQ